MINLLPKEYDKIVRREYAARRLVIIFLFIIILSLISAALLFPSYIMSKIYEGEATRTYETLVKAAGDPQNIEKLLRDLGAAAKTAGELSSDSFSVSAYELIRSLEAKSDSIKLIEISFINRSKDEAHLTLKGVAKTRESLTSFGKFLTSHPNLKDVDLPISNFAKESDISFIVTAGVQADKEASEKPKP